MSTLTEKQIQRIARQAVGGGSGGFSPSLLAGYATQEWVGENYLSIEWFNSLFNAVDSNGDPILPNDGNTSNIDSIKAMFGFWTEQYISALGQGSGGSGGGGTLAGLADVNLGTLADGQVLMYDAATTHWVNGIAIGVSSPQNGQTLVYDSTTQKWVNGSSGVDMSTVWSALAAATNEQINTTHLATALASYVTSSSLATTLADYVTATSLATTLADYVTSTSLATTLADYVTATSLSTTLADYVTATSLATTLADYGTKTWVGQNYVSIAFFNRLFQAFAPIAQGETTAAQVEPNDLTTTIDNIKAMFGLWTEQYISALGLSSGGGGVTLNEPLSSINNAALGTPQTANVAIVWNGSAWTYGTTASPYTLPTASASVLGGIKVGSTLAIDASGVLNQASGIATAGTYKSVTVDTYGRVTAGSNPTTISGYGITDAYISNGTIVLGSNSITPVTSLSGYATTTWVGQNYLPLSGGTITGTIYGNTGDGLVIQSSNTGNWKEGIRIVTASNGYSVLALTNNTDLFAMIANPTREDYYFEVYKGGTTYRLDFPLKNGTIAATSDIPTNNNQLTNGAGYITSNGSCASATTCSYPIGFYTRNTNNWSTTGLSKLTGWDDSNSGACGWLSNNNGQMFLEVDGCFYQRIDSTGSSRRVLDEYDLSNTTWGNADTLDGQHGSYYAAASSLSNYLPLSGGNMSGFINFNWISSGECAYFNSTASYSCLTFAYGGNVGNTGWSIGAESGHFYFWNSANTHVMRITDAGDININTGRNYTIGTVGGSGTNANAGYFSAGPGYSTGSGRYGLRFLVCDQSDAQTGLGQDLATPTGWQNAYNLCIGGGNSASDVGYISFVTHKVNSTSYRYIGGFRDNAGAVTFQVIGDIYATGGVSALSDARHKDIVGVPSLTVEQIATARSVLFKWNDRRDNDVHVGSIAQDWEYILPESIRYENDKDRTLSLQYGVAALVSSITIARKVVDHEQRIETLERENAELKQAYSFIKNAYDYLKMDYEQLKLKVA